MTNTIPSDPLIYNGKGRKYIWVVKKQGIWIRRFHFGLNGCNLSMKSSLWVIICLSLPYCFTFPENLTFNMFYVLKLAWSRQSLLELCEYWTSCFTNMLYEMQNFILRFDFHSMLTDIQLHYDHNINRTHLSRTCCPVCNFSNK